MAVAERERLVVRENQTLDFHLKEILSGARRFENAAQSVTRMILDKGVERVTRGGKTTYDFRFFRQGRRHVIGWYDETNEFINFVKDAAENGSSKEMAFVLIGEPGNGKTFFVEYVCSHYRFFLSQPQNRRYTFEFVNLDETGQYGSIRLIQSQTFEDPMILAMNLFESRHESRERLTELGFDDALIDKLDGNYRPLGACTEYIWNDIRRDCDGDMKKMLAHIRVVPVPIAESLGTVTGKYSARDKITASATDLLGEGRDRAHPEPCGHHQSV